MTLLIGITLVWLAALALTVLLCTMAGRGDRALAVADAHEDAGSRHVRAS